MKFNRHGSTDFFVVWKGKSFMPFTAIFLYNKAAIMIIGGSATFKTEPCNVVAMIIVS